MIPERLFLSIAKRLMRCPAAPYHEGATASEVLSICAEHRLEAKVDSFGNILVSLNRAPALRPLVFAAHLDHPGFVLRKRLDARRWRAEFRGGVGDPYFKAGVPLVLYPGGLPAKLGRRLARNKREFEVRTDRSTEASPAFAVWDLPEFQRRGDRLTGRVCDDLIGVASALTALICLEDSKARFNVVGAFTRAEEVGFHGALALADSKLLPRDSLIVSLETSRELPPVKMGSGVIIRVGDRASTFDSSATRFLVEVAGSLKCQRALMAGGTCEATAYQEYAYACCAVCVALGNYHNCGPGNRILPEYVSLKDALGMVELLMAAAKGMRSFDRLAGRLPARLAKYLRTARKELAKHELECATPGSSNNYRNR